LQEKLLKNISLGCLSPTGKYLIHTQLSYSDTLNIILDFQRSYLVANSWKLHSEVQDKILLQPIIFTSTQWAWWTHMLIFHSWKHFPPISEKFFSFATE